MRAPAVHPVSVLSEAERIDYLTAVAFLVRADGATDDAELQQVRNLCLALDVSVAGQKAVLAGTRADEGAAVADILARLREDAALCMSLLTDALLVVFSDGRVTVGESETIAEFARRLDIPAHRVATLARYVESAILGAPETSGLSADLIAGLGPAAMSALPDGGTLRTRFDRLRGR